MTRFTSTPTFKITPTTAGIAFAWVGMAIYAASNSIATWLVNIGEANPLADGSNAITFSNLFLLGLLISLVPMWALFRKDWTRAKLRALSLREYGWLTLSAFFSSALTPGLFFFALEHSNVTNVVLISRIEPILFIVAAFVFLKERIDLRVMGAGLVALAGAVLMISLRVRDAQCVFDIGEFAAIAATLSYVASTLIARRTLRQVPMGIFSIYRTAVGTVMYFGLISALHGPQEFSGIFAPVLWQWVWLYAGVAIVAGQLIWFFALKYARSGDLSLATSVSPLVSILFAMVILGEEPGVGFFPGAALILLAVFVAQSKTSPAEILAKVKVVDVRGLGQRRAKRAWAHSGS